MRLTLLATVAVLVSPSCSTAAEVALGGNSAVRLMETGEVVSGVDKIAIEFDRQIYYFSSEKEKQRFVANPAKYAPALGGDCVVCRVNLGVRMPGSIEFAFIHNQRAYLFLSAKECEAFEFDPRKYASADLALDGHCPVCAVSAKQWVSGNSEFTSIYDGIRYLFRSAEEKAAFDFDPAKFTPALEGDCVVSFKDHHKCVTGSLSYSALHKGRIYLFVDEEARGRFLGDPSRYVDVDVARNGNCVVCAKIGNLYAPGNDEFTAVYRGQRYLFSSAEERAMFEAIPSAFVGKEVNPGALPAVGLRVVGKTACAGCAYGVKPLSDSRSLGIAVVTDTHVCIVEGSEERYPELFAARSNGLTVELSGSVKKQQGKFVWVEPTSLCQAR